MTFEEAHVWCLEHEARWGFERETKGRGFVLWLSVDGQRTEIRGENSTDWGWLLIEAVARFADDSPTAPVRGTAISGTMERIDSQSAAMTNRPPLRRVI